MSYIDSFVFSIVNTAVSEITGYVKGECVKKSVF